MKANWWKYLSVLLLVYSIIAGLLNPVPELDVLHESIRYLYFHVPMWFSMVTLLLVSFILNIRYLAKGDERYDRLSNEFIITAVILGLCGLLTGMIWARFTWGAFWTNDPKLNSVAIGMLVYLAYLILRQAVEDPEKKARVAAVFNILAFPIFIVLIFILPRINASLHPGNGGNPGFDAYDLDSGMRAVFYPAVIGWILLGTWIATLRSRIKLLETKEDE